MHRHILQSSFTLIGVFPLCPPSPIPFSSLRTSHTLLNGNVWLFIADGVYAVPVGIAIALLAVFPLFDY